MTTATTTTGREVLCALAAIVDRHPDLDCTDDELPDLLDEISGVLRRGRAAVRRVQRDASDERPEAAAPVSECRKASDTASAGDRASTPAAANSVSPLRTVRATSPPWTPAVDWRSTYEAPPGRHRKPEPVAAEATTPIPAVVTPSPTPQQTGQTMTTTPQQPGQMPPGWPPPGSAAPTVQSYPSSPRKRRLWPWFVFGIPAGLFLLLIIIGVAVSPSSPAPGTAGGVPVVGAPAPAAQEPAPAPPPAPAGPATSFGDGVHVVGEDVEPGTYKTAGPGSFGMCYWARLSDTSGEFDAIIANGSPQGPATLTVAATDAAIESTGCETWAKTG